MTTSTAEIVVGGIWRRKGGKERAEVTRAWLGFPAADGELAVRCRPLHGGKQWWTTESAFRDHMALQLIEDLGTVLRAHGRLGGET